MRSILIILFFLPLTIFGQGPFSPAAGQAGSSAIHADSSIIASWATQCTLYRGLMDMADTSLGFATYGDSTAAIGKADNNVVSLGDSGYADIHLSTPITDQNGYEFAIFENSFSDTYLELAFLEVSSDGIQFVRFPSVCLTGDSAQLGSFGNTDPTNLHNLAGKYRVNYGTPFDLNDLKDSTNVNINNITHIRIIDVIGAINQNFTSFDSQGNQINDPYPTAFASGGFDLDAVAFLHPQSSTGLAESKFKALAYPNPSHGRIHLDPSITQLSLLHVNGQLLQHFEKAPQQLDLPRGMYIMRFVTTDDKHFTEKLIVR